MSIIKPEWIKEFFVVNYFDIKLKESIQISGYLSPQLLADFLSEKISEHYSILE